MRETRCRDAGRAIVPRVEGMFNTDIMHRVDKRIRELVRRMRGQPAAVRFADLCKVCDAFFGAPRQTGTSHRVYRTPWPGDPRVNIQDFRGMAKPYQVRQVLRAIDKLERGDD